MKHVIPALTALLSSLSVALAAAEPAATPLKFVEAEETQLKELTAAWKTEMAELDEKTNQTQGKKGSHVWWPASICAADLDGNGDVDLIFSHHTAVGTRIFSSRFKETGKLTFEDQTKTRTLSGGSFDAMAADGSAVVFDVNQDGFPDIINFTDESKPLMALNDGHGKFTIQASPFNVPQGRLMDLNGDGMIDVLVPWGAQSASYSQFINKGGGRFVFEAKGAGGWFYAARPDGIQFPEGIPEALRKSARASHQCLKADFNGDGRDDLLINVAQAYGAQAIACYRSNDGNYEEATRAAGLPYVGRVATIYDFNGDGALDILVCSSPAGGLYLNDGKGHFTHAAGPVDRSSKGDFMTTLDTFADFDEDGKPEMLLVTFRFGSDSALFHNRGGGVFEATGLNLRGAFQFVVCDMDCDGRLDLVAGTDAGPRIFLNRTPAAGHFVNARLKGPAVNPLGADAVVEAYQPGGLGDARRLICRVHNNSEGIAPTSSVGAIGHSCDGKLPVHLGLGAAAKVDLRVTFPGGKTVELKDVETDQTVEAAVN